MTDPLMNPLRAEPSVAEAVEQIAAGRLGQLLAIYASIRAKPWAGAEPLADLAAPIIDLITSLIDDPVTSVTAAAARLNGPVDDCWLLLLRCASGLTITLDVGVFLPSAFPLDREVRIEFRGTAEVISVVPERVAVTVYGPRGVSADSCIDGFDWETAARFGRVVVESGDSFSARIVAAARRSAEEHGPVQIGG